MKRFIIKESQLETLLDLATSIRDSAAHCPGNLRETIFSQAADIDDLLFDIEQMQEVTDKNEVL